MNWLDPGDLIDLFKHDDLIEPDDLRQDFSDLSEPEPDLIDLFKQDDLIEPDDLTEHDFSDLTEGGLFGRNSIWH